MQTADVAPVVVEGSRTHSVAYAGLTLATVGWAAAFIAGKVVMAEVAPLSAAAWRYGIAALVLAPFAWRQPWTSPRRILVPFTVMVVVGGVLYPWLFLRALTLTSATNASLLIALNPIFTLILSAILGERLERWRLPGVALALAGALTVISGGEWEHVGALGRSLNSGDLMALMAACSWACFNVSVRYVVTRLAPSVVNCALYGLGALALFALGWGEHPITQVLAATPSALAGILVMAVVSSVVAGQFFLLGVRAVGVNHAVIFIYLVPVLTAVLSVLLLGEHFRLPQAMGGAAVLAGLYWTTRGHAVERRRVRSAV